jgi:peptidoglycan/LPS O-acetylase OafA/YrhL
MRDMQQIHWCWKKYLIARLTRLQIALIPALLLGLCWDSLGASFAPLLYSGNHNLPLLQYSIMERIDPIIFIGNALFLQEVLLPTFGSNGPLWSLSYEFWYYILFPLLITSIYFCNKQNFLYCLLSATFFLLLAFFVGHQILLYFIIWLIGVAAGIIYRIRSQKKNFEHNNYYLLSFAFLFLFIGLVISKSGMVRSNFVKDLIVATTCGLLILQLLHMSSLSHSAYQLVSRKLSEFSYTIYLVNLPVFFFIYGVFLQGERWQPDSYHLFIGALIFFGVLVYAYLVSLISEKQTGRLRNYFFVAFGLKKNVQIKKQLQYK